MKQGDVINGYEILKDFTVVGAGLSKWTFAAKDGREYFLKEFLSPTYPDDDAPGSETTKARKRRRCAAFEAHHRSIQEATRPVSSLGGNLIVTLDFFRWGAKYYKVTEKVDVGDGFDSADVAALDFDDQLVIFKSVAHSVKVLHDLRIVHGDLKPSNVLIKRTTLAYTAKLIDFDSSYVAGEPPPPDEIVGTMNYYSPELVAYIQAGDAAEPARLGVAADVFALGLIFAEHLTGALPTYDRDRYRYPSIAVREGAVLRPADNPAPPELNDLVARMLLLGPAARPTIAEVHATLLQIGRDGPRPATPPPSSAPAAPSALRGKGLRTATRPAAPGFATETRPAPAAPPPAVADAAVPAPESVTPAPAPTEAAPPGPAATAEAAPPTPAPAAPGPAEPEAAPVEEEGEAPASSLRGSLLRQVRERDPE